MVEYEWNKELCERYADNLRPMVKYDHQQWAQKIAEHIKNKKENLKIIDIATGPGFLLIELAKLLSEPELIAQDATAEMLNIAEKDAQELNFSFKKIYGKAENIEIENDFADIATCKQLLHEAENPEKVISEMFRITKPGGQAFIVDFDKNKGKFAAKVVRFFMSLTKDKTISGNFWKSYTGGLEGSFVTSLMKKAGFKNVKYFQIQYNYFIFGEK